MLKNVLSLNPSHSFLKRVKNETFICNQVLKDMWKDARIS